MNMTYETTIDAIVDVTNTDVVLASAAVAGRGLVKLSMSTFFDNFARNLLVTGRNASPTSRFKVVFDLEKGVKEVNVFKSEELADAVAAYNDYVAVL